MEGEFMGFFSKLFGGGSSGGSVASGSIQSKIEKGFGLRFAGNGWAYDGRVEEKFAAQMGDPEVAFLVLKALREKLHFDKIVVLAGKPVTVVCNSQSPLCIVSALKADGIAGLIMAITSAGGKQLGEHEGAWLLQLP
jgi:hypothetical protein